MGKLISVAVPSTRKFSILSITTYFDSLMRLTIFSVLVNFAGTSKLRLRKNLSADNIDNSVGSVASLVFKNFLVLFVSVFIWSHTVQERKLSTCMLNSGTI